MVRSWFAGVKNQREGKGSRVRTRQHLLALRSSSFTILQELEIPSCRSWAATIRATGTIRKRLAVWPVRHVQNHTSRDTPYQPYSQAGRRVGPAYIAFGLIVKNARIVVSNVEANFFPLEY
jgi:hypothetical protein